MTDSALIPDGIFRVPVDLVRVAPHPQESTEPFYQSVIGALKKVLRAQGVTVTIRGSEHVPVSGGALLALNHTSYLDFIYGGVAAYLRGGRLVRFMAKKDIFAIPVVGAMMRKMRHISVDRTQGRASFNEAVARLNAGEIVGIFPESTISRSFELRDELKTGAARIAHTAGVPLIPGAMVGAQRMWTKDHPKRLGRTRTPVLIRFGSPVPTTGDPEHDTAALRAAMVELLNTTWDEYIDLCGPFEPGQWWIPASRGGSAPTPGQAAEREAAEKHRREAKKLQRSEARMERKARAALDKINPARQTVAAAIQRGVDRVTGWIRRR